VALKSENLICSFSKNYGGLRLGNPIIFMYVTPEEVERAVCGENGEIDIAFTMFILGKVSSEEG